MMYVWCFLVLLTIFLYVGARNIVKKHGMHALIWRWLSGHTHDGIHRTNAGWFTRGTKVLHVSGRATAWHHLPRIQRTAWRTGSTIIAVVIVWGFIARQILVFVSLGLFALAWAIIGLTLFIRKLRHLWTSRGLITPMGLALAGIIAISEQDAEKSITLAPDYLTRKQGELGRITLPPRFRADPAQREAVNHLVTSRMPVDVDLTWRTATHPQYLSIGASLHPPTIVPFESYLEFMHDLPIGEVMLGIAKGGKPYTGMLGDKSENPHFGISAQSGRGKSTMLVCTAAQVLHKDHDSDFTGIDPKMSSLDALVGLPNVTLACNPMDVEQMWTAIDKYHADMMERLRIIKRNPNERFPISLLTVDEANTCASIWTSWWNNNPKSPKQAKDGKTPPIWQPIAEISWMGRAVSKNLIIVGQRLDARATGGQGLRDSLGLIGLGGFRANQYKMLIEPTGTPPRAPRIKGRWLYFDSNETTWVQNLLPDISKLRDYSLNGRSVQPALKVV